MTAPRAVPLASDALPVRPCRGAVETGSEGLMVVGILGFGLGGVLSSIAVIGFGVLLGMRAHAED